MAKISQVKSQDAFPVTIRKLMRLGSAYAVTLPPTWVRSLNIGTAHYLEVIHHPNGYVIVRDLKRSPFLPNVPPDRNPPDRP